VRKPSTARTRREAAAQGIDVKLTREGLEADPGFERLFTEAKARASALPVRFIEEHDANSRTVFEVCATLALGPRSSTPTRPTEAWPA
jgi:hypothetical protein